MRYWNGYQWKRISNVEARLRRGRGEEVVDGEALPPVAPPELTPGETPKVGPLVVAPGDPVPTGAAALEALVGVALGGPAEQLTAVDLTDDELERLTAPSGEG